MTIEEPKNAPQARNALARLRRNLAIAPATDLKYMSYASEAVLLQAPGLHRRLLWSLCVVVLVLLVWAYFATVDEFTRGEGRIVPSSEVQIVQNLEGGILAKRFVSEGDLVEKDQPLLQIDDTMVASSFRERSLKVAQLQAKVIRLRAESRGTGFEEELAQAKEPIEAVLLQTERDLFKSRALEYGSKMAVLQQRVEQKRQELSSVRLTRASLAESHDLLKREMAVTQPLVEKGAVSHVELLRLSRQLNDLKGELGNATIAIPRLQSEHDEARRNIDSFAQSFAAEARKELNDATSELGQLQEGNQAYADRVARTEVKSPVRGTVKRILVTTIGGVIQPGMNLVEIVPIDDSLLVDAKVLPKDIAFISPGQQAMVKFTAYDFSIHGGLIAHVTQISPDTIEDKEKSVWYYQVRLKTDSSVLGNAEDPLPIIPGMTVQADILTGKKTVLDYLLKPILKTKELAFRER
ncbi:MAG: HlyD family type I secretion periplasmic adaptor subunit [Gammaproteobacteria bacterium]